MPVPQLHMMIKPASGQCNMRCRYCFYTDETLKREKANYGMMSWETLRCVIEKALSHATQHFTLAFQGGEPTLAGLPFFREAVRLCSQLNVNNCSISYALQTNGLLLGDEWCAFLAEEGFLVGVSLDGTPDVHDKYRLDAAGRATHSRVMEAIACLDRHGVDTNVLTVITSDTCRHIRRITGFYKQNALFFQQYIPCLDAIGAQRGRQPWSLTPSHYENYLKTSFDLWYDDAMNGRKRYHRYFDNLLLMLDGQPPEACGMGGMCGQQYVVEANGSVYPCDFYMLDEYRLGNLCTDTMEQINAQCRRIAFVERSRTQDAQCLKCEWRTLCRGGCRRDRDYFEKGIGRNYYCAAYKSFFAYAYKRLHKLYRKIMSEMGSPAGPA